MEQALAENEEVDTAGNMVAKPLTIENYFAMTPDKQEYWEKKAMN